MFQSDVSIVIHTIKHVCFGCLMMHAMHDLQCLNVGITPGCYTSPEAPFPLRHSQSQPLQPQSLVVAGPDFTLVDHHLVCLCLFLGSKIFCDQASQILRKNEEGVYVCIIGAQSPCDLKVTFLILCILLRT